MILNVKELCLQMHLMNFRTPLNAILNSFQFIENTLKTLEEDLQIDEDCEPENKKMVITNSLPKFKKFISMGLNSSILLLSLVEDILDLSKMGAGIFSINLSEFWIGELVQDVYELFSEQWKMKNIKLKIQMLNSFRNANIVSDKERIKQILLNLLSNSWKFTFEGKITIKVQMITEEEHEFVEFSIFDTGIGIKKENQKKLFKLLGMISDKGNLDLNGLGIGLTVSKKYVEYLGGKINLESKYGVGTSIKFTVKLHKSKNSIEKRSLTLPESIQNSVWDFKDNKFNINEENLDNLAERMDIYNFYPKPFRTEIKPWLKTFK